ncbi:MAG: MarR family transcriptional regulator [Ignavibacteriae bacterium]|nr:MarR family transcriptional regulator [Ignavibacteriota bacterium]
MDNQEKQLQAERMADLTFALLEQCQIKQERIASSLQLTVAEFKLLRSFRSDLVVTAGELAKRMKLSSSRLTRILDGLVAKGLARRDVGSSDRRVMEVVLTKRGTDIQNQLNATFLRTHEDILDLLPDGAGDSVLLAMEKLRDAMNEWVKD